MAAIIRITLIGQIADQDLYNSFWWVGDNAILADAQDLADAFDVVMSTRFETNFSTTFSGYSAIINMWTATPGSPLLPGIPYTPALVGGDETSDALPQGTSLLLNFKAYGVSPNRKRMYVGGFCENVNTAGLPSSALISQGNLAIADLLETVTVNTHDYLPAVVRLDPEGAYVSHHVLDSGFCSANWARLRSRRSR